MATKRGKKPLLKMKTAGKKAVTAKKAKAKRGSAKKESGSGAPATSLQSLGLRVKALEGHVADLRGVPVDALLMEGDARQLEFGLVAGSARIVRITLLDNRESIVLGTSPELSRARASGVILMLLLETWGDPGQQAIIGIVNAVPAPLRSSVLQSSYLAETRSLRTQW
jgi:hypothetical protein